MPVVQQTVIMPEESVLVNDPYEHTLEIANEIELFPGMLRTRICFIPLNFVIDLNSVIYLLSVYSSIEGNDTYTEEKKLCQPP